VATSSVFEVKEPASYPNPYNTAAAQGLVFTCNLTQSAEKVSVSIYTSAFRLVARKEWAGSFNAGRFDGAILPQDISRLSSGTYYYIIEAQRGEGKARARAGVMVVIR